MCEGPAALHKVSFRCAEGIGFSLKQRVRAPSPEAICPSPSVDHALLVTSVRRTSKNSSKQRKLQECPILYSPEGLRPTLSVENCFWWLRLVFLVLWAHASGQDRPRSQRQCAVETKVCPSARLHAFILIGCGEQTRSPPAAKIAFLPVCCSGLRSRSDVAVTKAHLSAQCGRMGGIATDATPSGKTWLCGMRNSASGWVSEGFHKGQSGADSVLSSHVRRTSRCAR